MTVKAMQDRIFETQSFPLEFPYKKFQKPVLFAPHPDDEVFGCGGLLALWMSAGVRPQVVVITKGQAQGEAQARVAESLKAASLLGGYQIDFWELTDRELRCTQELVQRIADYLLACNADIAFAPSLHEPHPDHQACALAALWSLAGLSQTVDLCFYESGAALVHCTHIVDISSVADLKLKAMQAFSTQELVQPYSSRIAALNHFRALTLGSKSKSAEGLQWLPLAQKGWGAILPALDPLFLHQRGQAVTQEDLPLVSILIRTIGDPRLEQAIASVLAQSYQRLEIVVVSANGAKQKPAWLEVLTYVRWITLERNLTRPEAANAALDNAKGDFCMFLDEDDLISPGHIEKLVLALKLNVTSCAAHSDTQVINELGHEVLRYEKPVQTQRLVFSNTLPIHSVLFSRNLVYEKGCRFDSNFPVLEDWDFWLQISTYTSFTHVPGCSAVYRYSDRSQLRGDASHPNNHAHMQQQLMLKWLALLPLQRVASAGAWFSIHLDQAEQRLAYTLREKDSIKHDLDRAQLNLSDLINTQADIQRELDHSRQQIKALQSIQQCNSAAILNYKIAVGNPVLLQNDFKVFGDVERCELSNGAILLQGWFALEALHEPILKLIYNDSAGDIQSQVLVLNRTRHDVETRLKVQENQKVFGFFYYSAAPEGSLLCLCVQSNDKYFILHKWAEDDNVPKLNSIFHRLLRKTHPWLYLLHRSWFFLKSGQLRGFVQKVQRHTKSIGFFNQLLWRQAIGEGVAVVEHWDCLIFDHDMGGGANLYRSTQLMQEVFVDHRARVALVTYSILLMRYTIYQVSPKGKLNMLMQGGWLETITWLDKCKTKKIFLNNLVSFPQALQLVKFLVDYLRDSECKFTIAMHDFFAVCPSQHLQHASGNFCEIPDLTVCRTCLAHSEQAMVGLYRKCHIEDWRASWLGLLKRSDDVRIFDKSAISLLNRVYPLSEFNFNLSPHTVSPLSAEELTLIQFWKKNKKRKYGRIGIVGSITSSAKGCEIVSALVGCIEASGKPYNVVVIGDCLSRRSKLLRVTGAYLPENLTSLIVKHDIDIFLFPSVIPETFSYTLHEIIRYNLPVASFNLGAQASVLASYSQAILLELSDKPESILEKIEPFLTSDTI